MNDEQFNEVYDYIMEDPEGFKQVLNEQFGEYDRQPEDELEEVKKQVEEYSSKYKNSKAMKRLSEITLRLIDLAHKTNLFITDLEVNNNEGVCTIRSMSLGLFDEDYKSFKCAIAQADYFEVLTDDCDGKKYVEISFYVMNIGG